MAKLELVEVTTKEELDAVVRLRWKAFRDPIRHEWWLMHIGPICNDYEAAMTADLDRQWKRHTSNPSSHWIYVKDESGQVLGCTQWLFFQENPFPEGLQRMTLDHMPEGEAREFTEHIVNQIYAPRLRWVRRPHAALNQMGVHPEHRNRGIGRLLMDWGIQRADELGLESLTEASPLGRWLYESYGYGFIMAIALDSDKKDPSDTWRTYQGLLGQATFQVMWRPKLGRWDGPQYPWECK